MKKIKHLLVDLDGTLVDSRERLASLEFLIRFVVWWKPYSNPWKTMKILRNMATAIESDCFETSNEFRAVQALAKVLRIADSQASLLLKQSVHEIFPKLEKYFFPVPGALDFIRWAHLHYPLILATNPVWDSEIVEMRMKWGGFHPHLFRSMTHAKRMKACKPSVVYYRQLLEQEGLDPRTCLLIGNDMNNDGSAVRAGMRVFILSKHPTARVVQKKGVESGLLWTGSFIALKSALENETWAQ